MKLLRKYMPGFLTAFFILFTLVPAAFPALLDVGPTVPQVLNSDPPQHGYPLWYRDNNRVPLEICLSQTASPTVAGGTMCDLLPGLTFNPIAQIVFPTNFPDEAFWWAGSTQIKNGIIRATLVMAIEAAWSTGAVTPGEQIAFNRIRFIVDTPVAGTYTLIHPYGTKTFLNVPAGVHAIFDTEDIGVEVGKFTGALKGGVGPFLRWDSGVPITVGTEQFIGDPNVPHTITGSPVGNNFFMVVGPAGSNLDGAGNDFVQTNLFSITGKIHTAPISTPLTGDRVTYARDANGMQLSVFTTTNPISNVRAVGAFPANFALNGTPTMLHVSGVGIPPTPALATNTTSDGKYFIVTDSFPDPGTIPATVQIANTADVPVSINNIPLTDEVAISKVTYDLTTNSLTIAASSSDRVAPPALQAFMPGMTAPLGNLVNGQLVVTFPVIDNTVNPAKTYAIPPQTITVSSFAGGSATLPMSIITTPPPAPTLVGPSGTVTTATPTYTWNVVPGATSYTFYNNFENTSTNYAASAICNAITNTCSVTPAVTLPAGTNVGWIVAAINSAGSSPYSAANYFVVTVPVAPTLVGPSGNVAAATPTYTWNVVADAASYTIYDNFSNTSTNYAAPAICNAITNTCSVTPAVTLPAGTNVGWIVAAINSAGSGPWSAANYFTYTPIVTVPVAPTLVGPSGNEATATPTYTWNVVADAASYTIYDNFSNTSTNYAASAICSGVTNTCSVTPAVTLPAGTNVGWIVAAINIAGSGPWSAAMYFVSP